MKQQQTRKNSRHCFPRTQLCPKPRANCQCYVFRECFRRLKPPSLDLTISGRNLLLRRKTNGRAVWGSNPRANAAVSRSFVRGRGSIAAKTAHLSANGTGNEKERRGIAGRPRIDKAPRLRTRRDAP